MECGANEWPFYQCWKAGAMDSPLAALERAVAEVPDSRFMDVCGECCTYAGFDRETNAMAHALEKLGVKAGDRLISFSDTNLDTLRYWFAANKIGAIWVPVNTAFRGSFLSHQVNDAGGKLLLCGADQLVHVETILADLVTLETVLVVGPCPPRGKEGVRIVSLDAHRGGNDAPVGRSVDPAEISCLIYTSGTTGPSKGCMISHNQICHFAWRHLEAAPQRKGEVAWTCLPIFHVGALVSVVLSSLLSQSRGALTARFSVSNFWADVEQTGARISFILATMWPLLAEAPDNDAMKRCHGQLKVVTGVPVTPAIRRIFQERFGVGYINCHNYAQTESSKLGHVAYGAPQPPDGSAGFIADMDYDIMVADDDDREVPRGAVGELLYRPKRPHIMFEGYWGQPEETCATWRNLWMHSGDLVRVDEKDVLTFIDRKKDYLRRGGENVSSWEVEATFHLHPCVEEVAVHAVKSQLSEDDIKATCVLSAGAVLSEEELMRWIIPRLPRFAVPRYIEFRAALPKTPTGRVQKFQLRDDGCTPATWDRQAAGVEVPR